MEYQYGFCLRVTLFIREFVFLEEMREYVSHAHEKRNIRDGGGKMIHGEKDRKGEEVLLFGCSEYFH